MKQQQTHEPITPWKDRLNFAGERSPSNKERMAAMEAEIKELRRALQRPQRELTMAIERAESKLETARAKVQHWRKLAYHHQAELKKAQKALKEAGAA